MHYPKVLERVDFPEQIFHRRFSLGAPEHHSKASSESYLGHSPSCIYGDISSDPRVSLVTRLFPQRSCFRACDGISQTNSQSPYCWPSPETFHMVIKAKLRSKDNPLIGSRTKSTRMIHIGTLNNNTKWSANPVFNEKSLTRLKLGRTAALPLLRLIKGPLFHCVCKRCVVVK